MPSRWVHFRVDEDFYQHMQDAAAADHRSLSNWAALMLRQGLAGSGAAYLIEVADTKDGVCYPTTIGPFPSAAEASLFADRFSLGRSCEWAGGCSDVHVISRSGCSYSPERYRDLHAGELDDEE